MISGIWRVATHGWPMPDNLFKVPLPKRILFNLIKLQHLARSYTGLANAG